MIDGGDLSVTIRVCLPTVFSSTINGVMKSPYTRKWRLDNALVIEPHTRLTVGRRIRCLIPSVKQSYLAAEAQGSRRKGHLKRGKGIVELVKVRLLILEEASTI